MVQGVIGGKTCAGLRKSNRLGALQEFVRKPAGQSVCLAGMGVDSEFYSGAIRFRRGLKAQGLRIY